MNPLLRDILSGAMLLALATGGVGLGIAITTKADVVALKEVRPHVEERLRAVETSVTALKSATDERALADKEYREALRDTLGILDGKLDTLVRDGSNRAHGQGD